MSIRLRELAGLLVAGILAAALPTLWTPALARENWRAAAEYILTAQQASPTLKAAVVAHVDYTQLPLAWYLRKATTGSAVAALFSIWRYTDSRAG